MLLNEAPGFGRQASGNPEEGPEHPYVKGIRHQEIQKKASGILTAQRITLDLSSMLP
jgi:hypothetical protein